MTAELGDADPRRRLEPQVALDGDGDSITRSDLEDKIKAARQKIGKKK